MPEGPEISIYAERLHKWISGKEITNIEYKESYKKFKNFDQLMTSFENGDLHHVTEVTSKGKKIIIHLSDDHYLVCSLGMEGKFQLNREDKHTHLKIFFISPSEEEETFIGYNDTRHFGEIKYTDTMELDLGIDILTTDISDEDFIALVRKTAKRSNMKICEFILSQKYISGVGNYIRSDALYLARVDPFKTIREITDNELKRIIKYATQVIRDSYKAGGALLRTYEGGGYQCVIYGKAVDLEGNPVMKKEDRDKRTVWYSTVQLD